MQVAFMLLLNIGLGHVSGLLQQQQRFLTYEVRK